MFNLNLSKTYFHPVVFDTVDGEGKKLKIEFDAEFPRLSQSEIKEILDAKPVDTSEETANAFTTQVVAVVKSQLQAFGLNESDGISPPTIAAVVAQFLFETFGDRIREIKTVTDEIVAKRVLIGFRKVKDGDSDVAFSEDAKSRILDVRGAVGAIAKSWLKSIGIEGAAKN